MSTAVLILLHLVVSTLTAGAWLAAGVVAAGHRGPLPRTTRLLVAGLAAGGALLTFATLGITIALAARGWWFAGEKVVVDAPLALVALVIGGAATVLLLRGSSGVGPRLALLSAGYAALAGCLATVLLGYPVPPVAVAVLLGCVGLASALTGAILHHGGRRAIVGLSSLLAMTLVASIGWAWMADVAAPASAAAPGHAHGGAASASDAPAPGTSVADLRLAASTPGTVRSFDVTAAAHDVRLASGRTVSAWGFGGDTVPGPEIRVRQGEIVDVTLRNTDIDEGVTLHWHGYDVPAGDDGVAGVTQDAVKPGESFRYRFLADTPGSYWYHTHQASSTGVQRGLYGMLVVEPAEGVIEQLEVSAPVHTIGGRVLLGVSDELTEIAATPSDRVRLRLVNTDQLPQRFLLAGAPFTIGAIDGQDLDGGAELDGSSITVAAGSRADLLLTMPETPVRLDE